MSLEPILLFVMVRYFWQMLRKSGIEATWQKLLLQAQYAIVVLVIAQEVLHLDFINWIWSASLIALVILSFKKTELSFSRKIIYAVLPLIVLSVTENLLELISKNLAERYSEYYSYLYLAAFTWMIAMFLVSRKERKALEEERKKRQQEEERSQLMAAQKAQLEGLVAERTAELTKQKEELQHALEELKATQSQLIQSEKMASLGELTAGIAHEIQNPLNFVNNFSEVNTELVNEVQEEVNNLTIAGDKKENLVELLNDLMQNQQKITYHGKRADAIVKGMLQHSRKSTGKKEPIDINALADEYLRLSYHGLRAKDKSFNADIKTDFDSSIDKINVVPQDIGRVLLNLFNNAFYSVQKKKEEGNGAYQPIVSVSTKKHKGKVEICIKDNGMGIPQQVMDKIFQPFFTTKPTGQGTGLGLSLSYDIIKAHGGELKVETEEEAFAEFIILLPA